MRLLAVDERSLAIVVEIVPGAGITMGDDKRGEAGSSEQTRRFQSAIDQASREPICEIADALGVLSPERDRVED